jgi:transcriptional regulator with XRE-family HTH domain
VRAIVAGVPKSKLPKRELAICSRFRAARERIGVTQDACARALGMERTTLTNYEYALRFCRHFVVSEEFMATGKYDAVVAAGRAVGVAKGEWDTLETIFFRQCVDLLSEPVCHQLRPRTLFSEAYDSVLGKRYAELVKVHFWHPRVVLTESDKPALAVNLLNAYTERWFKLLANEARSAGADAWFAQRCFTRGLIEMANVLWKRFIGKPTPEIKKAQYDFARALFTSPDAPVGPLTVAKAEASELIGEIASQRDLKVSVEQ